MAKKTIKEVTIRSSAAEYLTFVAATGDSKESVEVLAIWMRFIFNSFFFKTCPKSTGIYFHDNRTL